MSRDIRNIIVVGGGHVGSAIITGLLNSPHEYSVSVLSREASSYTPPAGTTRIKTDYTHESLVKALMEQDAVVSAISGHALLEQIKVIDAAIEAGVRRFVPSEFGGDTRNEHSRIKVPYFALKYQVLEYLQQKQGQIEWTAFFSGPFLDETLKNGILGFSIPTKTATQWDPKYASAKYSASRLSFVASAVAQSLSPALLSQTANQYLAVRDATVSPELLLAALEKTTGTKWTRNVVDMDEVFREGEARVAGGDIMGVVPMIVGNLLDGASGNDFDEGGIVSNGLLGIEGVGLEEIVEGAVREVGVEGRK
ncbi:hypothetical protein AJ79_02283 [Helicocarpus griseus UAMH5409]|uniref:NmrA-like domain-containing protein n=1 Tax=Helicocarpus griseus UAMH5409 TaxID=1447875 RepID=A0A2B7Y3G5_9EURO|nr:hypothetical protein AJ79_02283 [Helicocarpus griseus UAMH5409]